MHWTQKRGSRGLRDEWFWLVKAELGINEPQVDYPVHVHIIRVANRLIDDSNLPAGTKYLIDAIVEFGHAVDDSRKWMRTTYDQRRCRKDEEPHMEVTISP